jgi:hypothetical protein|nr:MAG TPA: hypothetical protein [Caudoviricetes sp.]
MLVQPFARYCARIYNGIVAREEQSLQMFLDNLILKTKDNLQKKGGEVKHSASQTKCFNVATRVTVPSLLNTEGSKNKGGLHMEELIIELLQIQKEIREGELESDSK